MQVSTHATRIVGRWEPGVETAEWIHAGLWIDVFVADWDVRRSGHVHVVARPGDLSVWRPFDIASHPMRADRVTPPPSGDALRGIVAALESWLASWPLEMHRHGDIGLVSELGESRVDFQRRVMAVLRPELQRRVADVQEAKGIRWPWRRRATGRERAQRRDQLAAHLAELGAAVETRTVDSAADAVRRAEIGTLVCPREIDLPMGRGGRVPDVDHTHRRGDP